MGLVFIASATASSSATLEFTSGIDSTYNEYQFQYVNMHPATDGVDLGFQVNAAGASGFNETITSTNFRATHNEAGDTTSFTYDEDDGQAQGTAYQSIGNYVGNDNDQACNGILTLYDPSSTTFVKHFVARGASYLANDFAGESDAAGYINTTLAIDGISFKFSSGNIDTGTIYMYGVG